MNQHGRRNHNPLRIGTYHRKHPASPTSWITETRTNLHTPTQTLIPNLEITIHIRSKPLDHTREFHSHRRRRLRGNRVLALTLQEVHAVQTKSLDLDQGLTGRGGRFGDVIDEEVFGGAGAVFDCCDG